MQSLETDVVIVGGGPAGLGAAHELRRLGVQRVTLLERDIETGGVPRHCGHSPFGLREFGRVLGGQRYGRELTERALRAGVDIRLQHSVIEVDDGGVVAATPEGRVTLSARATLLATGIRETSRAGRLLPGQRPLGILTTGALQDLIYLKGLIPFRRPLIVGSELVTMSAILTCRSASIRPVVLVEDEPAPRVGRALAMFPYLIGLPVHYRTMIDDIFGSERVEAVRLRHADGRYNYVECDGILLTGRFTPESSLARLSGVGIDRATGGPAVDPDFRTSRERVYAAGNVLRAVKTAGQCWSEGRHAARGIAADLGLNAAQESL